MDVLDGETLTRATVQRQWLSARRPVDAVTGVEHLVAVQAQEPQEPYVGLWSRLADFEAGDLSTALEHRQVVRTHLMRRTMHLVTAGDARILRPLHDAMLRQRMLGTLRSYLADVDLDALGARAARLLAERPATPVAVARELAVDGVPAAQLGDALTSIIPLVQVPPRGLWRRTGPATSTTYDAWLGAAPADVGDRDDDALAETVRRYLRAYGPAATADLRAWSGLSGLPAVVSELAPELRTYRDPRGRVLHDLVDGPGPPPPDLPLPVRFLPAFDNAVLGYDDRSRVIDAEHRHLSVAGARYVLVAGRVAGTWTTTERSDGSVEVSVTPLRDLTRTETREVRTEAESLAAFLGDGRAGSVRL